MLRDPSLKYRTLTNRYIQGNLLLQQLLYYNVYYSAAWFTAVIVRIVWKYRVGLTVKDPDVVRTVLLVFWLLAEPLRLLSGYYGNLQENVPWLVVFIILTLAPQTPVCYYLMMEQYHRISFDRALQIVMAIMIHLEVLVAAYTVRSMSRAQKRQFYLFEAALQEEQERNRMMTTGTRIIRG